MEITDEYKYNRLYGCSKRGCTYDLNERCPKELMLKGGGGCHNPCEVYHTPEYCCNNSLMMCEPTSYSRLFSSACPRSNGIWSLGNNPVMCYYQNLNVTFCPPDDALSIIKVGSQLRSYDQLLSISGNFTLGFFDEENPLYIGIWYTNDAEARKVWVANPNKPIISDSGTIALSIDPNTGNLIVTAGGTTLMKITDVQAGPNPNVTAMLEDTGNFRLINEIDKMVLWQSFDHPTDVLLPGMKLGHDMRTKQNWTLTSG
ncbi:putative non-specific serine/threonine protein kinase [Helianthus annuus]|nr:putative non-specific serine/threonine protein kinase [Helianthus annuus]